MEVSSNSLIVIDDDETGNYFLMKEYQEDDGELKIGMKVNNEDEAYNLYNNYAIRKGFSIRKAQIRRGKGDVIRQRNYVCWKEGFHEDRDTSKVKMIHRLDTRTGCKAHVRFSVKSGVWEITSFFPEHNHELVQPEQRHLLKSNRNIAEAHRGVISSMIKAGIKPVKTYSYLVEELGGVDKVGFTERDCHNYVRNNRQIMLEAGDAQSVIDHFKRRQAEDSMFFYSVQVDQDNRMTNFFWRDGRSKIDYDCFGDAIVFDTTFRTNKYNMICAPFVGINHHWKNVLLGCAFLMDETEISFTWLFQTFLESMGYKQPKTIFTDQARAIANAIEKVFQESQHRLCLWHISKNATQNISHLYGDKEFKKLFSQCFYACDTEAEFESLWNQMIEKFNVGENKWLKNLYGLREKWCPAFSLDTFSAKMRATQRSESTNRVFSEMSTKTMNLIEFLHQYERRTNDMRSKELAEDFRCHQGIPSNVRGAGILKHGAEIYTITMYSDFEKEFVGSLEVQILDICREETTHTFRVIEENHKRHKIVQFKPSDCTIKCSCKMFEAKGLLCRHALRVLNLKNITKIPVQYILKRWTKDAKKGFGDPNISRPLVTHDENEMSSMTLRLSELMHLSYRVMTQSALANRTTEIARNKLVELVDAVEKELKESNVAMHFQENGGAKDHKSTSMHHSASENPILDPMCMRPKGVSNARIKSNLEKRKKGKQTVWNTKKTKSGKENQTDLTPPLQAPIYLSQPNNPVNVRICESSTQQDGPFTSQESWAVATPAYHVTNLLDNDGCLSQDTSIDLNICQNNGGFPNFDLDDWI